MKGKIITLGSGKELLIIDVCRYNGIDYCFACEVFNNDITDVFLVIRIDEIDGKRRITVIQDEDIIKHVFAVADKNLS